MKRLRGLGAFALACALALGAVNPALAHERPGGPGRQEGRFGNEGMGVMRLAGPRALDGLDLTAEQREKVQALFRDAHRDRRESRDGSMRDVMRDLRDGSKPDPSARKKLADEMAGRILDETRTLSKLHAILTPKQRDLLQEKMERAADFKGLGKDRSGLRDGKERPGFPMGRFSERLNLTEAQKARAEMLFKSWEKPQAARHDQLLKLGREMGRRAFAVNPDTRRIEADAKKMADLAVDGLFERTRHMEDFRSMLTEEQKKILDEGPLGRHSGRRAW